MMFKRAPSRMPKHEFVSVFGGVYEYSPWIAEQAWAQGVTQIHDNLDGLAGLLSGLVDSASCEQQLNLILAHPDLAGKAAQTGNLTAESTEEQSGAGIDQCSAQEFKQFQNFNQAYRAKFKFPFIMAVKGSDRYQILSAFEQRLPNCYQTELKQALQQIHKIARFRLTDLAK